MAYDLARLRRLRTTDARMLAFVAFDCAVDSWSLVDWVWEWLISQEREPQPSESSIGVPKAFICSVQRDIPELRICRQLATGAKHFQVRRNNREDLTTFIEEANSDAPDNSFFSHMKFASAWIVEDDKPTLAYRVFDRASMEHLFRYQQN
ncbi:MAG: hypothetical protein ACREC1_08715 [Methylovirgula sp.]